VIDIAERKSTTVELKITYLRPVTSHKVTARSHLLRTGKTLCVTRVNVFDDRDNFGGGGAGYVDAAGLGG